MQAKSNAPYPVMAFTGREFVTYEWRPVPSGHEEAARNHPMLDVRERKQAPVDETPDATDAAVELAAEHGIDLNHLDGSGVDGRILVSDVEGAIDALDEEE